MTRRWLGMAAGGMAALLAAGAAGADRPVVLELFTSEGCSSCPPADRLLGALATTDANVLPLDFHVTYWDRLGWKDPFALAAATERQDRYAALFGDHEVYTPEMVIDGRTGVVGSDETLVRGAIAAARRGTAASIGVSGVRTGAGVEVAVEAGHQADQRGRLLLVGFDGRHETVVGAGENDGRRLAEVSVVRSVEDLGDWSGQAIRLRAPAPAGEHAALLLQAADGTMLGDARVTEPPH